MRAGRNVDTDESANALSLLEDIDMSGLHRSVHVHQMLGDLQVPSLPFGQLSTHITLLSSTLACPATYCNTRLISSCNDRASLGARRARVQAFKEYYYEQRQLQLLNDITPPASMLENHRAYLSHIAGFFIVEEKVKQSTDNIIVAAKMRTLWTSAVASIKNGMDNGFLETDSTAAMLVVKDYVFLTASCLATQQFDVSAIMVRARLFLLLQQDMMEESQ